MEAFVSAAGGDGGAGTRALLFYKHAAQRRLKPLRQHHTPTHRRNRRSRSPSTLGPRFSLFHTPTHPRRCRTKAGDLVITNGQEEPLDGACCFFVRAADKPIGDKTVDADVSFGKMGPNVLESATMVIKNVYHPFVSTNTMGFAGKMSDAEKDELDDTQVAPHPAPSPRSLTSLLPPPCTPHTHPPLRDPLP